MYSQGNSFWMIKQQLFLMVLLAMKPVFYSHVEYDLREGYCYIQYGAVITRSFFFL